MKGKFITIEGSEGTGKTYLVQALSEFLQARGLSVLCSREPGGTSIADDIRMIFRNQDSNNETLTMEAELMLVSAARAQHVRQIIAPALQAGKIVLCDRFADSTRVYQGCIGGLPTTTVEQVIAMTTFGIVPDLTIVLESRYEVVKQRLAARSNKDAVMRYDPQEESEHDRIQQHFKELCAKGDKRLVCLDTSDLQVAEAVAQACRIIETRLGERWN